jgi:hypothetical protein
MAFGCAAVGVRNLAMRNAGSAFDHWAKFFPTFQGTAAMCWKTRFAIAIVVLAFCGRAIADEMVLEQIYGSGVHAFNDGDLAAASDAFTAAIKGGTNDPRAYYFRALTFIRLGREQDAKADFEKGAALEAVDASNVSLVSRSMERVQGRQRQMLEQYRTIVRAAALERKEATDRAVRQAVAQEERSVRRKIQPIELPSNPDASPGTGATLSPGNTADANPFEQTAPVPVPDERRGAAAPANNMQPEVNPFDSAPAKSIPKTSPQIEDSPFGDAPAKTTPKPSDNPFGDDAATPAPNTGGRPTPGDNSTGAADKPAPGAIAGLFHAFVAGAQPDEPAAPPADGPGMNLPAMIQGMMGGGQSTGAGPPSGNGLPPGDRGMPMPGPGPGPATGNQPPTIPAPTTPPQTQPAPKPSDNPFD